ncbi:hypothetical protein [Trichococcus ilyis]|uniref:Uncharacterized protein n=1 Tax=Trichococcus ilyis TaxID=640938 RepID=A0A143Y8A1_9LACT|nr:hypothetical protein [Trichococcus ilyis]CZQ80583.1 Hypothetical protein TR210_67 [Trichococcus ilyis]SEI55689.1 hypothetical protein SAMN05216375_101201 [Trichococcus ilyis]
MFRKETIKESVSALPLQPGDYCVITGTALVMHGIKEETKDIDISCTKEAFQALAAQGFPIKQGAFARKVVFSDDVEIFEDWHTGVITMVEGVPVASLESIIVMKQQLGREKDLADITKIEARLSQQ